MILRGVDVVQGHAATGTYHAAAEKQAARRRVRIRRKNYYEYAADDDIYRLVYWYIEV